MCDAWTLWVWRWWGYATQGLGLIKYKIKFTNKSHTGFHPQTKRFCLRGWCSPNWSPFQNLWRHPGSLFAPSTVRRWGLFIGGDWQQQRCWQRQFFHCNSWGQQGKYRHWLTALCQSLMFDWKECGQGAILQVYCSKVNKLKITRKFLGHHVVCFHTLNHRRVHINSMRVFVWTLQMILFAFIFIWPY